MKKKNNWNALDWILLMVGILTGLILIWWIWQRIATKATATEVQPQALTATVTASTSSGSSYIPNTATVPNPASGLTAVASPGSTALSWMAPTAGTAPTGYKVMRRTGSNAFAQIGTVAAPNVTYNDTTGVAATAYEYQIISTNAQGDATASNTTTATAQASNSATVPNPATGLAATASPGSTALSWVAPTAGTAPTGYKVMRRTVAGSFVEIATVNAPAVTYSDTTGVAGTFYYYQVVATNAQGNGTASNTVNATAQASNAYGMTGISVQETNWSQQRFQVTPTETNRPAGALSYVLLIKDGSGNTVYDFGNPTLSDMSYPSVDFTPNNHLAPVSSQITTPGTYTVELTCNGITRTQSITFTATNLISA